MIPESQLPPATGPSFRASAIEPPRRILAVDDDSASLFFLEEQLCDLGYEVRSARDGQQALDLIQEEPGSIDVVLLDKNMPVMDGITMVKRLKYDPALRHIPVIMQTGDDQPEEIRECIEIGVFYYLTKPIESALLRSVIGAALHDVAHNRALQAELKTRKQGFQLIDTCRLRFRTLEQSRDIATFLASCFPEPEQVLPGLSELLINAVEHGNLGIGYELKSELVREGTWREEIERRLDDPQYAALQVEAVFKRKADGYYVVITDQGKGFKWRNYMQIDPSRASDSHGRGIALAATLSFDRIVYNDAGTQCVGFIAQEPDLDW